MGLRGPKRKPESRRSRAEARRLAEAYPPAPEHLSVRAQSLWRAMVERCTTDGRRVLLQTGLEALDRATLARESIATEGMTATTASTGVAHVNPLIRVERDARNQFAAIFRQLGLDKTSQYPAGWPFRT